MMNEDPPATYARRPSFHESDPQFQPPAGMTQVSNQPQSKCHGVQTHGENEGRNDADCAPINSVLNNKDDCGGVSCFSPGHCGAPDLCGIFQSASDSGDASLGGTGGDRAVTPTQQSEGDHQRYQQSSSAAEDASPVVVRTPASSDDNDFRSPVVQRGRFLVWPVYGKNVA